MALRLAQFWQELRGAPAAAPSVAYALQLPETDAPETVLEASTDPPTWTAQPITGRSFVLSYTDSKGQPSDRHVRAQRLDDKAGILYLYAFCFARDRLRSFRADRIRTIIDPETGEVFEPGLALLAHFTPDGTTHSRFHYGLAPRQFADFNAALNVLAFMARCDGRWHPLEAERIEEFAAAYWLRGEIAAPLDLAEVNRHAARLSPDAETFWTSLHRCAGHPVLAPIIRRHVAAVIDADGVHHPHEVYWGQQVDAFLSA